jgi:uncharacterized protein YndB with AHSA1/START domain
MSRFARTLRIEAPSEAVWSALVDLETWPTWASQFKRIEPLDPDRLRVGSRVRVRPKGMPGSVWQVVEYVDGRLFTWTSALAPGLRIVGGHELAPQGESTDTTFWLDAQGPVGRALSPILRRILFSRNTRSATEGLKRHVERRARAAPA